MKRVGLGALVLLGAIIAGCGGGGGSKAIPATQPIGQNNATVPSQLLVKSWGAGVMRGATYVGPVTNANLSVNVLVHQQNAQGLVQYAQMANDPGSADYHKWLTPQDIATRYGATLTDYQNVANYFVQNGVSVAAWPQRLILVVSGPQANMQRAFGTTFGMYEKNGKQFVAPMSAPHFQQQLAVDAIGHIADYRPNHTYIIPGAPRVSAGYATGFSPSTTEAAFDYIGAFNSGYNGSGVTLGIIGTDPIDTTASGKGDADLNNYLAQTHVSNAAAVHFELVQGTAVAAGLSTSGIPQSQFPYTDDFTATPPPPWAVQNEGGEAQLDTQQASALAPGSNLLFYFAYNANDGCSGASFTTTCPASSPTPQWGLSEADAEIQQVIADNTADVISMSYGGGEQDQGWTCYSGCADAYEGSYSQLSSQLSRRRASRRSRHRVIPAVLNATTRLRIHIMPPSNA